MLFDDMPVDDDMGGAIDPAMPVDDDKDDEKEGEMSGEAM